MLYVIEMEYVGADQNRALNSHFYIVQDHPGLLNMSKEPCLQGWLGTTNDWSEHAHGEFETLAEAQEAIEKLTNGEYRVIEADYDEEWRVVVGLHDEWGAEESQNWCYDSMMEKIDAGTTDVEIEGWAKMCARDTLSEANGVLDEDAVIRMAVKHRNDLIDEVIDSKDSGDIQAMAAKLGIDGDQDWENETTTFEFPNGVKVRMSGSEMSVL